MYLKWLVWQKSNYLRGFSSVFCISARSSSFRPVSFVVTQPSRPVQTHTWSNFIGSHHSRAKICRNLCARDMIPSPDSVFFKMSLMPLASKTCCFFSNAFSHCITVDESHMKTWSIVKSCSSMVHTFICDAWRAALSSSFGVVEVLIGATLVFPMMKETLTSSSFSNLK